MQRLKTRLTKVIASGFIQVFLANIVSYLVAFCGSIIYVRLMGAHEFGIYTFSYNIISFFLLVNGFGAASGVLQFVSRTENKQLGLAYLKFSMRLGIVFNCFLSLVILIYAFWVHLPIAGSRTALIAMAFFPVGRLYIDVYQAYLRATQQNQLLAKFAISTSLILLLANILGIVYGALIGFIISTYISYGIIILLASFIFKLPNLWRIQSLTIDKKEFISYSIYATFGNAFAQLVYILDILILGYLVKDAVLVTTYKVATIIPFALNFIPGVISTFFYPYFARHADNLAYIRQLRKQLQLGMLLFSGSVSLGLIALAKPLIALLFGPTHLASVLPFQILAFGFWIVATFRTINGNIIASLGKAKAAMRINIVIVSVNIVLTYFLVLHYGIIGAAVGVVLIYILASVIAGYVVRGLLKVET